MLLETGKNTFCLSLDTGKQSGTFRPLYIHILGYLKVSNAVAHSVDSDIFYAVIYLSARSKTYSNLYFSKYSRSSLNGHSRKRTALLTAALFDTPF